ncbi:YjbQ family protein [Bacillus sp. WP8]|uniref:YjbQ family protein n=1 Tax=Bacillus sp. WP8 TaxID=756828 RepID=UPI0037BF6D6A
MLGGFDEVFRWADRKACDMEGNRAGDMKGSYMGGCEDVLIDDGDVVVGRWEGMYLCEFEGGRDRDFYVEVW